MSKSKDRADFEAFVEQWTGRDMDYHVRAGTWGVGEDSFAWACWQKVRADSADLLASLIDCVEDTEEALAVKIASYGRDYRPERLARLREQAARARAAIAKATGETREDTRAS